MQVHGPQAPEGFQASEIVAADDCVFVRVRCFLSYSSVHTDAVRRSGLHLLVVLIPGLQVPLLGPAPRVKA